MKNQALIIGFILSIFLSFASVFVQRVGPIQGSVGTECGNANHKCYEPVLNGGFPLPFLIDIPTISIPDTLNSDDEFRLWALLIDVTFYFGIFLLIRYLVQKRRSALNLILLAGSICACMANTGYQKQGDTYIYATADEGLGYVEHPIENINVASFQVLSPHGYAKDKSQVYYHQFAIPSANSESFTALSDLYGKDKLHVYYEDQIISGANPASFTLFDIQWGKDSQDVYFQDRSIQACEPDSFILLEEGWQKDGQCVYNNGDKLLDADPASFVILNFWFAKDKNNVYYNSGQMIENADAETFEIREGKCEVCAEDKNSCYRYEEPVACETLK